MKALAQGLHVMLFSDNVVGRRRACHQDRAPARKDLLVMGPDCGTAIVNGIPLGFANVVRRGDIGLVAASGTGLQEVTCRIHNLGGGVSQALGTGGRDLKEEIGGITMLQGLARARRRCADARDRADLQAAGASDRAPDRWRPPLRRASRWSCTFSARHPSACAAACSPPNRCGMRPTWRWRSRSGEPTPGVRRRARSQRGRRRRAARRPDGADAAGRARALHRRHVLLRGAARVLRARPACRSNAPGRGRRPLDATAAMEGHVFIDMGDDDYTRGRPHPMIDPSLRNAAIRTQGADPATAAILFDVVLGFGSHADPARRPRRGAGRRAARRARARTHAGVDRPRLRHRWRSAGPGGAGAAARSRGRDHRRQQRPGGDARCASRGAARLRSHDARDRRRCSRIR